MIYRVGCFRNSGPVQLTFHVSEMFALCGGGDVVFAA